MKKKALIFMVTAVFFICIPGLQVFAESVEPDEATELIESVVHVTRLEFIADIFGDIIAGYEGTYTTFSDVSEEHAAIVAAAVHFKIANGHDDGTFGPHEIITSEQAVAMSVKFLGLRDHALALSDEFLYGQDLPFWITPYYKWIAAYHEELMPLFTVGAPASAELIEMLREIIAEYLSEHVDRF